MTNTTKQHRERFHAFATAAYFTLVYAFPAGAAGWAAAWGLDAYFGLGSSKPIWFLPIWCTVFFCLVAMNTEHFTNSARTSRRMESAGYRENQFRSAA